MSKNKKDTKPAKDAEKEVETEAQAPEKANQKGRKEKTKPKKKNGPKVLSNLKAHAVGYNTFRGTSFKKLKSKILLEDLYDGSNFPLDASKQHSEFILQDGHIYDCETKQVTNRKEMEILHSLR